MPSVGALAHSPAELSPAATRLLEFLGQAPCPVLDVADAAHDNTLVGRLAPPVADAAV